MVEYLSAFSSNHIPLLLDFSLPAVKQVPYRLFRLFWVDEEQYGYIIRNHGINLGISLFTVFSKILQLQNMTSRYGIG